MGETRELRAGSAALIEKGIVASPFGRLLGLHPEALAVDHVRVRLPFRPEVTTVGEMVHGGAIGSLVDVAATAACWAHPDAGLGDRGSTVDLSLHFLSPGLGRDLIADARVTKRGRSLCVCEVRVHDDSGADVARAIVTYRLAAARAEDPQLSSVRRYAEAKSRQDVTAALADCHAEFTLETLPFATASRDRDDTADQLRLFFAVFPDYSAETEGLARNGESVAWWGRVSLSFRGAIPGLEPTGRRASIPAFSVFDFREGLLLRERFFFDLPALCDGIGVPLDDFAEALAGVRNAAA